MSVSDCPGELQDSNGRFSDVVALDIIVVTLDRDCGLTAIGDIIATGEIVVTGQVNPNENQGIRDVV